VIILKDDQKQTKTKHNSFWQKRLGGDGEGVHYQVSLRNSCKLIFVITAADYFPAENIFFSCKNLHTEHGRFVSVNIVLLQKKDIPPYHNLDLCSQTDLSYMEKF